MNGLKARIERLTETIAPPAGPLRFFLDLRALAKLGPPSPIPPEIIANNREARRLVKHGAGGLVCETLWDDRPALAEGPPAITEGDGA